MNNPFNGIFEDDTPEVETANDIDTNVETEKVTPYDKFFTLHESLKDVHDEDYYDLPTDAEPEDEYDLVSHPWHYTSGNFEVIDIIEDQLGLDGLRAFCLGNAIKYICRSGKKCEDSATEDLEKAIWYLNHYVEREAASFDGE